MFLIVYNHLFVQFHDIKYSFQIQIVFLYLYGFKYYCQFITPYIICSYYSDETICLYSYC